MREMIEGGDEKLYIERQHSIMGQGSTQHENAFICASWLHLPPPPPLLTAQELMPFWMRNGVDIPNVVLVLRVRFGLLSGIM